MLYWKDDLFWIPGFVPAAPPPLPPDDPDPSAVWEDNVWYKRWYSWKGWYVLENYPIEERYKRWDWAYEKFGDDTKMIVGDDLSHAKIYFRKRDDAAFFKLTWL